MSRYSEPARLVDRKGEEDSVEVLEIAKLRGELQGLARSEDDGLCGQFMGALAAGRYANFLKDLGAEFGGLSEVYAAGEILDVYLKGYEHGVKDSKR